MRISVSLDLDYDQHLPVRKGPAQPHSEGASIVSDLMTAVQDVAAKYGFTPHHFRPDDGRLDSISHVEVRYGS